MEHNVEVRLHDFIQRRCDLKDSINAMMQMEKVAINEEARSLMLFFPVQEWQLNPAKTMHGGMICTLMDMSMAAIAYSFSDAIATPTISMACNFDCAVYQNEELHVTCYLDHLGKKIAQTRVIVKNQDGKIVASANGSYAIHR